MEVEHGGNADLQLEDVEGWSDENWGNEDLTEVWSEGAAAEVAPSTTGEAAEGGPAQSSTNVAPPTVVAAPASSVGLRLQVGIKAGMDQVDRNHVNAVIAQASEGSAFWKNEERKEERTSERITQMLRRRDELEADGSLRTPAVARTVDAAVAEVEAARNLTRCVVHIDMDSFYAAVEERDNPELRGKPMAVGGIGMLSTSNYAARKFGVRAAMPGYIGKKLCPSLIIVKPRYSAYKEASEKVHEVLARWDPNVRQVGMDEAYLDMTSHAFSSTVDSGGGSSNMCASEAGPAQEHWGEPECLARVEAAIARMRTEISEATGGLTASAGIAPNRMIAKIASDVRKPNGQFVVPPTKEAVLGFVERLPVRKVGGIGKVTASILERLGIVECRHLFTQRHLLSLLFSRKSFMFFLRSSLGVSTSTSFGSAFAEASTAGRKSISTERTFRSIADPEKLRAKCRELCASLARDVEKHRLEGRNVGLKLKTVEFTVLSRAVTLPNYVRTAADLQTAVCALLNKELQAQGGLNLRLIGVRLSALRSTDDGGAKAGHALDHYLKPLKSEVIAGSGPAQVVVSTSASGPPAPTPSPPSDSLQCPVCQTMLPSGCDANAHIDECLSKRTIRELVKSHNETVSATTTARPKKKPRVKGPLDMFLQSST